MEPDKTAPQARTSAAPLFPGLLLVAATLAVYWPAIYCGFLNYDDPLYFTSNPQVLTGLTPGNVVWAFTTTHASNWHPLTWLSLMLDAELFGQSPIGPHVTNVLLHVANTVLVFLLFRRITAATWRSALVAALFALHPLHVESVAWVTERKDVLSAFFGLLSLWAYVRFVEASRVQRPEFKVFFALSLVTFALGLMSKPVLVMLPLVMLLLDWWPLRRVTGDGWQVTGAEERLAGTLASPALSEVRGADSVTLSHQPSTVIQLIFEKWPFLGLSIISCVVTFIAQQKGGAVAALTSYSLPERVGNAFVSCARYLGKTFWPAALATPYPHPGHWPAGLVLFAAGLFIVLSVAAVRWRQKLPFAPVGWFWFVGMLIPVIGLIQVGDQSMADRYTYLPLIGVFLLLVWGLGEACRRWRMMKPPVVFLAAFMLAACVWQTRQQLGYWQDSGTLFRHALAVTENNYVAENELGTWLAGQGQIAEAMDCYRRSLQIKPGNVDAIYDLGNAFARLGDWDNAIADYRRALEIAPNQADVLNNLGFALAAKQQFAEAIASFNAALTLNPDSVGAHNNLATLLFRQHRFDQAEQHYREALRLSPDNPQIHANLGDTLVRLGRIPEAVKCYQEALRLRPDDVGIKAKLQALGVPTGLESPANF